MLSNLLADVYRIAVRAAPTLDTSHGGETETNCPEVFGKGCKELPGVISVV